MDNCIFCKIANDNSTKIYENEHVVVINDIHPKTPVHLLVMPKMHIENLNELEDENLALEIFRAIKAVTKKLNIKEYKTLINTGASAGQIVFHLHIHIMGDVAK